VAQGSLYCFRLGTSGPVYVLAGDFKFWVKGGAEAARLQVDQVHAAQLSGSEGIWFWPTRGQLPSKEALAEYVAETGDTPIDVDFSLSEPA
jgi:hypothetical protein